MTMKVLVKVQRALMGPNVGVNRCLMYDKNRRRLQEQAIGQLHFDKMALNAEHKKFFWAHYNTNVGLWILDRICPADPGW